MGEQTGGLFSSPGVEVALEVTPHPYMSGSCELVGRWLPFSLAGTC